jgi:protein-disulfide isomerase
LLSWLAVMVAACGGAAPAPRPSGDVDHAHTIVAEYEPPEPDFSDAPPAAAPASSDRIPIGAGDPRWGAETAPVTIVSFVDLECPPCASTHSMLQGLMREYGEHRLRVVFKHMPLRSHERARDAAAAAQAVWELGGSRAFLRFVELVFQDQQALDDASLARHAEQAGIATTRLFSRAREPRVGDKIEADAALARSLGVTGAPAFRINGIALSGAPPLDELGAIVKAELVEASRLADSGTPSHEVYAARVAANDARPPERRPDPPGGDPPETTRYRVPVGKSPVDGSSDALVTLVEFADFQCPFCARVQPTLSELKQRYGTQLRIVFKHNPLPFHPRAMPAAMLAIEARAQKGDPAFWQAATRLFELQAAPGGEKLDEAALLWLGKELGLNAWRTRTALSKARHKKLVEADQDLADDVNARGTPSFFVNGRRLAGAQPIERFVALIDAELAGAKQRVQERGIPASRLYDDLMKDAVAPPGPETRSVPAAGKTSPSRGAARAPISIQIFSDFQCPFCARVQPTLRDLEKEFPGKLRLVWRDLPLDFHKNARPAATAAREALAQKGNKGFWRMHDLLFEAQSGPDGLDRARLEDLAAKLGLDLVRFRAALEDGRHDAAIDADLAVARQAGISGTPGFSINGYFVSGAQPLGKFRKVVRRALDDARRARP